jgi:hypothetical protein
MIVIFEFADGSKATCESGLEKTADSEDYILSWVESWQVCGEPDSLAARHVEARTRSVSTCL